MKTPIFSNDDWNGLKLYLHQMAQALTLIEGGQGKIADFRGAKISGERDTANTTLRQGEIKAIWFRTILSAAWGAVGASAIVSDELNGYTYIAVAASGTLVTDAAWTVHRGRFVVNPVNGLDEIELEAATANPTAVWADRLSLTF